MILFTLIVTVLAVSITLSRLKRSGKQPLFMPVNIVTSSFLEKSTDGGFPVIVIVESKEEYWESLMII